MAGWPNGDGRLPRRLADPNAGAVLLPIGVAEPNDGFPKEGALVPEVAAELNPVLVQDGLSDAMGEEVPKGVLEGLPKPDGAAGTPKVELAGLAKGLALLGSVNVLFGGAGEVVGG